MEKDPMEDSTTDTDRNPALEDSFKGKQDSIKAGEPFWQWLDEGLEVSVYSAHYDDVEAPPVVRVVGLARDPLPYSNVTCRYHGCHGCPVIHTASGHLFHFRNRNGRKFLGAFIVCPMEGMLEGVLPFAVSVQKDSDSTPSSSLTIHYSDSQQASTASKLQDSLFHSHSVNVSQQALDKLRKLEIVKRKELDYVIGKDKFLAAAEQMRQDGSDTLLLVNNNNDDNDNNNNDDDNNNNNNNNNNNDDKDKDNNNNDNNNNNNNGYRWNITRCFPAFQKNYDKHVLLAEMVAASRALGVDHFHFYVESVGPSVSKTLQVLQERGLAEVLPWNLHMNTSLVFYKGQFPAIEDCLFRHLRSSRYLLFGDIDELFMPRTSDSLVDLLDHWFAQRPKCGAFLFLNTFFSLKATRPPPTDPEDTDSHPHSLAYQLAQQHQLTMLLHNQRDSKVLKPGYRSKVALDPRRTLIGSVHLVDHMRKGSRACVIDPEEALLFHFRKGRPPSQTRLVTEDRLWRFAEPVVRDTMDILEAVNKIGA